MKKDEFLEKRKALKNSILSLKKQELDKSKELDELCRKFCVCLCEQYAEFQNKNVRITFERVFNLYSGTSKVERKVLTGFLVGFSYNRQYTNDIYCDIAKIKKDGTASKVLYSCYDMFAWDKIVNIELIE